ncbi:ATP-binding cassette domain-containing protein [Agrococcus versicolor]|uniref:ATP-binding cassette domain-containing protein n=1 Tax=Agrococcus versicolor TaxID=501482 RepID=A0ABN3AK71_9MICO
MSAIEAQGLGVERSGRTILRDVSLQVPWGSVTGLLGTDGAGKSTTIRRLLGLIAGRGTVRIAGVAPERIHNPARVVGVALDALAAYPAHTPRMHLEQLAVAASIGRGRVPGLLEDVGLADVADPRRRVPISALSLGMRTRLAIAGALVGAPRILVLDEPFDGLDPMGRHWLRDVVRQHADRGGAVLLSAHGLDEVAPVVDRVVVLDAGRVRFEGETAALRARLASAVDVRTPYVARLRRAVEALGATVVHAEGDRLRVAGVASETVAWAALAERILVLELTTWTPSLDDAFVDAIGPA